MKENIIEIIDTKITDQWGVFWDEMETVRDFLQNFYDANEIGDINITIENKTVKVSAPSVFDYQELIYLGSDKGNDANTIGQYGEGWKASVLNALRNFNCSVEMMIEDKRLIFYFEDKKIGETYKRVIFCKVLKENSIKTKGSVLILGNCNANIISEFRFGLRSFYFEQNPIFGEELTSTWDKKVSIYKSTDKTGYVFYKKLLRSRLDAPLVIVCNKAYQNVEVKIKHDRDRKSFNDEVLERLLKYAFKSIPDKKCLVEYMKEYWSKGHKLLAILADSMGYYGKENVSFSDNYYAKDSDSEAKRGDNFELILERDNTLDYFKKNNYICCPHYMSQFGMKTATSFANEKIEQKLKQNLQTYSRGISFPEQNAINLLLDFIKRFSQSLYNKCQDCKYVVGETEDTIKDLTKNRKYGEKNIFLNKLFFTYSFSDSLVTLVREFDKLLNSRYEGDFSDFYITLISSLLKDKQTLEMLIIYEANWNNLIKEVVEYKDFIPVETSMRQERLKKINEARHLFINGKIVEMIEKINDFSIEDNEINDEFILLTEQFNSWNNRSNLGFEDNRVEINKIKSGFLALLNKLKN